MLNSQSIELQKLRECGEDVVLLAEEVSWYVLDVVHCWHVLVDNPLESPDVRLLCLYQLLHQLPTNDIHKINMILLMVGTKKNYVFYLVREKFPFVYVYQ